MTAELAVALPAVVLVLGACLGALRVGTEQVRLVDAAAVAARLLGRGETPAAAGRAVTMLAGAELGTVTRHDGLVCATATIRLAMPVVDALPIRVTACSVDDMGIPG